MWILFVFDYLLLEITTPLIVYSDVVMQGASSDLSFIGMWNIIFIIMWPLHSQSYCNISMKNGSNVMIVMYKQMQMYNIVMYKQGGPIKMSPIYSLVHEAKRYTQRSFPRSWLITGFVTKLTRRLSPVQQDLLTLPEHLSSPPVLVGFVLLDL